MIRIIPPYGLGKRLNKVIAEAGKTPLEVARAINYSPASVYKICSGETCPNAMVLAAMCRYLNVSADYIIFGEEGMYGRIHKED